MAVVSDIEIRLRADIARLQQDMDRARQQVGGAMTNITQMAKKAGAALAGIAAGLSIAAFAGWIKSAIDATDAASDLAQRTGIAVEELAGLQLWFQIGGAEAGAFESSMVKLAKSIADGGDAFKSIGVATRNADGSLRSNVQVLLDSGDAFAKMEEGTYKTAKAIELFGKSGAVLLPILNSGSEGLREMTEMADKLGLTFDQKTVDAAGKFNDTLDFMGLASQGVGRKVAAELLPTLNSLVSSLLEFITSGNGVQTAAQTIAAGFKIIYTLGVSVVTLFTTLGKVIAGSLALVTTNAVSSFEVIARVIKGSLSAISSGATGAMNVLRSLASGDIQGAWKAMGDSGKQVGDALNSTFSDVWSTMQTNAIKSGAIVKYSFEDIADGLKSGGKAISDVWSGQQNLAIEAFATVTSNSAATADAVSKDAKEMAAALKAVDDILKKSNDEWDDLNKQLADNMRDLAAERYNLIQSAKQETEQNEFLVETFGMTEAAIIRVQAARLLEQEAQRLGRSLTEDEIADLNRVIELKERSAKAVSAREELEAAKTFWTDIEKTARDTFISIADGGKNAFQRLKDTAKNTFFDWLYQMTIKKWIINIGTAASGTAGVAGIAQAATGASGIGEAFSLAGSAKSLYGAITGGATLAGGLGTGFLGSLAGGLNGAGVGSGLTSALGLQIGNGIASTVGSSVATGISSALSGAAAALPWVAGAFAAYTIATKAFGRGPKEMTGNQTLNGSLGANGFAGTLDAEWVKKGGWFRSDKNGVDKNAVDSAVATSLGSAYEAIKTTSADFARVLGINADSIANRTQALSIAMGKDEAANQKAIADFFTGVANTVAGELLPEIAKFQVQGEEASSTLQRLATNYAALDQILAAMGATSQKAFGAVGVASLEARERLIAFAGGLDALATQTTYFNDNFLSQAEQITIIQKPLNAALDELGYAGITTADQFKTAVLQLAASGKLATEEGAKTYTGLLAIAPAFKTVSDYLKELSDAAAETALALASRKRDLEIELMELSGDAVGALAARRVIEIAATDESLRPLLALIHARQDEAAAAELATAALEKNEEALRAGVDAAFAAVGRAVAAQRDQITAAYKAVTDRIAASITAITTRVTELTRLSDALAGSLTAVESDTQSVASRGAARAQVQAAIAIAKASGVLPSVEQLQGALSSLKLDSSDQFSSLADYQREVARTNAELQVLGGMTDKQLTDSQRQLAVLEDQKALAEHQYNDEMARLDGILDKAQAQVDAINGVRTDVQSLLGAIAGLNVAIQALKQGATPSNPTGGPLSLTDLYATVLGRTPDAAGYEFWQKAYGDVIDSAEYADFIKAAQPELEAQARLSQPPIAYSAPGSGTMLANADQQQINDRMEKQLASIAASTEKFASQFENVSGGGQSLFVENVN